MKNIFISLIFLALTACAAASKTDYIPLPVQCPAPVILPKPTLPIDKLTPASSSADYVKAMTASLNTCVGFLNACYTQAKGYQK